MARCLGLIDRVEQTQKPLIVTKRGRPMVEVIPCVIWDRFHFVAAQLPSRHPSCPQCFLQILPTG